MQEDGRHYVHLSASEEVAKQVGRRHTRNSGYQISFEVRAGMMHREGSKFYLSENNVWLISQVPPQFLQEI